MTANNFKHGTSVFFLGCEFIFIKMLEDGMCLLHNKKVLRKEPMRAKIEKVSKIKHTAKKRR